MPLRPTARRSLPDTFKDAVSPSGLSTAEIEAEIAMLKEGEDKAFAERLAHLQTLQTSQKSSHTSHAAEMDDEEAALMAALAKKRDASACELEAEQENFEAQLKAAKLNHTSASAATVDGTAHVADTAGHNVYFICHCMS